MAFYPRNIDLIRKVGTFFHFLVILSLPKSSQQQKEFVENQIVRMLSYFKEHEMFPYCIFGTNQCFLFSFLLFCGVSAFSQTISIDNPATVAEGDVGPATITFTISLDLADPINDTTVDYTINGGNEDGTSSSVLISSGDTTATVDVTTTGDTVVETDEAVSVTLDATDNGSISATDGVGSSSFTDDDSVVVSIDDPAAV
ncbi:MAG: hypothetical protein AAGB24_10360, partial [Bacteroidota bacterium]